MTPSQEARHQPYSQRTISAYDLAYGDIQQTRLCRQVVQNWEPFLLDLIPVLGSVGLAATLDAHGSVVLMSRDGPPDQDRLPISAPVVEIVTTARAMWLALTGPTVAAPGDGICPQCGGPGSVSSPHQPCLRCVVHEWQRIVLGRPSRPARRRRTWRPATARAQERQA